MRTYTQEKNLPAFRRICNEQCIHYSYERFGDGMIEIKMRHKNGDEIAPTFAFELGREIQSQISLDIMDSLKRQEMDSLQPEPPASVDFSSIEDLLP